MKRKVEERKSGRPEELEEWKRDERGKIGRLKRENRR
jgi:hypothetical protein